MCFSTSAPSERIFSTTGQIITKLQASLNFANADDLIFLYDSWPVLEIYELEKDEKQNLSFLQITVRTDLLVKIYSKQTLNS